MDTFGFVFATAFLVAAFAVFAILGRLMDTVSAGIGSTVAPTLTRGFRAWTPPVGEPLGNGGDDFSGDDGQDERDAGTGTDAGRRADLGLSVPVTGLAGRHPH